MKRCKLTNRDIVEKLRSLIKEIQTRDQALTQDGPFCLPGIVCHQAVILLNLLLFSQSSVTGSQLPGICTLQRRRK